MQLVKPWDDQAGFKERAPDHGAESISNTSLSSVLAYKDKAIESEKKIEMENELSKHLAKLLHSTEEYTSEACNGGAVIELLFDLQIMNIETLEDFKKRQSEDAVKELIQEYLDR